MKERLIFRDFAEKMGTAMDISEPKPGAPMVHNNVWSAEKGKEAIEYLRKYADDGYFEFDGHGDCWLMMAAMYALKDCDINAYIMVFDGCLKIRPYALGDEPAQGQPCTFSVEEKGDDVLLTVHLEEGKGPFDMPFEKVVAPVLPDGKKIYVRLDGRHLLNCFPLTMTYGEKAAAMYMDYAGQCVCCLSNVDGVDIGDRVSCPF